VGGMFEGRTGVEACDYLSGQLRPMLSLSLSDGGRETGCCTYYSIYKEHLFPFLLI